MGIRHDLRQWQKKLKRRKYTDCQSCRRAGRQSYMVATRRVTFWQSHGSFDLVIVKRCFECGDEVILDSRKWRNGRRIP